MKTVQSIDVHFVFKNDAIIVNMSVQEAFNVLMMPAFTDFISCMFPIYGLSPLSEPENKE